MFNISGSEIIVILLLALVVLGPEKLPDAMRRAGRTYAELKRMSSNFQSEMRNVLDEPMKEMRDTADLLRNAATFDAGATSSRESSSEPKPTAPKAVDPPASAPAEPAAAPATEELSDDELVARTLSGGAMPAPEAGREDTERPDDGAGEPDAATETDAGDGPATA